MTDRDRAEIEAIRATTTKLMAETARLADEARFPPVIVAAVVISLLGIVAQVLAAIYGAA